MLNFKGTVSTRKVSIRGMVKLKTYVATTLILAILLLTSVGYVLTSNGTTTVTLYPYSSFVETADYVIFRIGNTYYAKNGSTGEPEFSSTNASYVIQSTANALTNGLIFFKNGVYDIEGQITVPSDGKNIILMGEDWEKTVFKDSRTGATQTIGNTADLSPTSNLTIKNIKFDRSEPSDTTTKYCVYGSWKHLRIEHCKFLGNEERANDESNHYLLYAVSGNIDADAIEELHFVGNYIINFQAACVGVRTKIGVIEDNYVENAATWALGFYSRNVKGRYLISNNILKNCAWYDEGIAIDAGDASSAAECDALIYNNLIFNEASKPLGKGIAVITTNGVSIIGNKIVNEGTESIYWGAIGVDGRTNTVLSNIEIMNNVINTTNHYGMRITDLVDGVIKGNQINVHDFSSDGAGIRLSYRSGKAFGTGTISVEDNNIVVSGSASTKDAFYIRKFSSGGSGSITIQIDGNKVHAASKFVRTNIADILSPIIGKNNYYSVSGGTLISDEGTVKTKLIANSGTATISSGTSVTFDHGLAGTPTLVLCSFNNTGYGDWKWSATSTQITITVTNSGTYEVYWYAEYKP